MSWQGRASNTASTGAGRTRLGRRKFQRDPEGTPTGLHLCTHQGGLFFPQKGGGGADQARSSSFAARHPYGVPVSSQRPPGNHGAGPSGQGCTAFKRRKGGRAGEQRAHPVAPQGALPCW